MPPSPPLLPAALLVAAMLYASVRYVGLGDVPASDLPLYVANKAVALTSVTLFARAALLARRTARPIGELPHVGAAAALAFVHVLATLALLRPPYDAKWAGPDGRWTLAGSLALIAGAVAAALLRRARTGARALGALGVALIVHTVALGGATWARPSKWPGGLPPITLVAAAFAVVIVGAAAWTSRQRRGA